MQTVTIGSDVNVGNTVIMFSAPWCASCKKTEPGLSRVMAKFPGVKVLKANVNEVPELSSKFQVFSLPTIVMLRNGKDCCRLFGPQKDQEIEKEVKKAYK